MARLVRLLKSFSLIDLLKGMWVTLKYTPQPAFTFPYPAERRPTAPRFRGVLRLQVEPGTSPRARPEDQTPRLFRFQPVPLQLLRSVR